MSNFIDINTYPFTKPQIRQFRRELEKAGNFDSLMLSKEALKNDRGFKFIPLYADVADYREKYLTGVYTSLQEHFNTQTPYIFWAKLYEILRRVNPQIK